MNFKNFLKFTLLAIILVGLIAISSGCGVCRKIGQAAECVRPPTETYDIPAINKHQAGVSLIVNGNEIFPLGNKIGAYNKRSFGFRVNARTIRLGPHITLVPNKVRVIFNGKTVEKNFGGTYSIRIPLDMKGTLPLTVQVLYREEWVLRGCTGEIYHLSRARNFAEGEVQYLICF